MIKRLFAAVCLASLVLTGCGPSNGFVPITGRVMLDGKPLAEASISFIPDGSGRQATGFTDANGTFELSTVDPKDGVMPGKYKVIIQPVSGPTETATATSADEAMLASAKAAAAKPKGKGSEFPPSMPGSTRPS